MLKDTLLNKISARTPLVNGWLSADSPYLAETLSHAGFDAVTVDVQHGMFGLGRAVTLLQAIGSGPATPFARAPSRDAAAIGKLLDAGALAIICPGIDDACQAADFVAMCRYPPTGVRSFGPARANLPPVADYVRSADAAVMTWAMIESIPAMQHLDEIVAVKGLDGVYVGPNDLALALGEAAGSSTLSPQVEAALDRVVAAAHTAGILAGSFCADGLTARRLIDRGYDLVTPGNDMALVRSAATQRIEQIRGGDQDEKPA